jgi:hypothetical protein
MSGHRAHDGIGDPIHGTNDLANGLSDRAHGTEVVRRG